MGFFDDLPPLGQPAQSTGFFDDLPPLAPQPSQAAPQPQGFFDDLPPLAPSQEIGLLPQVLATGARVAFPVVGGAIAGYGTGGLAAAAGYGLGSMAGETVAQAIESAAGRKDAYSVPSILGQGLLGAATGPISSVTKAVGATKAISGLGPRLGKAAAQGLEGAFYGAAGTNVESLARRGELASGKDTALGAGVGGVLGGTLGALSAKVPAKAKVEAEPKATGLGKAATNLDLPALKAREAELLEKERLHTMTGAEAGELVRISDQIQDAGGRLAGTPEPPFEAVSEYFPSEMEGKLLSAVRLKDGSLHTGTLKAGHAGILERIPEDQLDGAEGGFIFNGPSGPKWLNPIEAGELLPKVPPVKPGLEPEVPPGTTRHGIDPDLASAQKARVELVKKGLSWKQEREQFTTQEDIAIADLLPTQTTIDDKVMSKFGPQFDPSSEPLEVTRVAGKLFVLDGHHRLEQARRQGVGMLRATVTNGDAMKERLGEVPGQALGQALPEAPPGQLDLPGLGQAHEAPGTSGLGGARPPGAPPPTGPTGSAYDALGLDEAGREAVRSQFPEITNMSPQFFDEFVEEIKGVQSSKDINLALLGTESATKKLRFVRQVTEAFTTGKLDAPKTKAVLESLGFTPQKVNEAVSAAGMTLGTFGRFKQVLTSVIDPLIDEAKKKGGRDQGAYSILNDLLLIRRSLLTTQMATAMRNSAAQAGRYVIETMVNGLKGALGDIEAKDRFGYLVKNFNPAIARKELKQVFDEIPELREAMSRVRSYEQIEDMPAYFKGTRLQLDRQKFTDGANKLFNFGFGGYFDELGRTATIAAEIQTGFKQLGLDYQDFIKSPNAYLSKINPEARKRAADVFVNAGELAAGLSFAEAPTGFFREISMWVARHPILTLATPFPRFMGSAFGYIKRHNPAALVGAFRRDAAGDPNKLRDIYARATVGTGLFAAALALKSNVFKPIPVIGVEADDNPFSVRIPDTDRVIDLRAYFPLTLYMVLADAVDNMSKGKPIGDLKIEELKEGLLAQGKFSDAVPAFLQISIAKGDVKELKDNIETIAGDILGGFGVGVRTYKDVLEGIFQKEYTIDKRATDASRTLGPLANNLPFVGELTDSPELINPTTGKDAGKQEPVKFFGNPIPTAILRQLSGVSVRTVNAVERELRKHDVNPFSIAPSLPSDRKSTVGGIEQAQVQERNLTRTLLGPLIIANVAPRLPQLAGLQPDDAKLQLMGWIKSARDQARTKAQLMLDPEMKLILEGSKPAKTMGQKSRRNQARQGLVTRFGRRPEDVGLGVE